MYSMLTLPQTQGAHRTEGDHLSKAGLEVEGLEGWELEDTRWMRWRPLQMPCGEAPVSSTANQGAPHLIPSWKVVATASVLQYHDNAVAKAASFSVVFQICH